MFVLVAVLDPLSARITENLIAASQHQAFVVDNSDDLLQVLSVATFDGIVVDLDCRLEELLPVIKLHRFAQLGDIEPVMIGLTVRATAKLRALCAEAGIAVVLQKPVQAFELDHALRYGGRTADLRATA